MSNSDETERIALGEKLRKQREYLGFSQDEVADSVGMPRSAVSLVENGQRKVEALELKRFARLYEKSIGYFTDDQVPTANVSENILVLTRLASKLTSNDLTELQRFAEFLQVRKDNSTEKKDG